MATVDDAVEAVEEVRPRFDEISRLVLHLRRSEPLSVERAAERAGVDVLEWERIEGRHGMHVADVATYHAVARVLMPEDAEGLGDLLCQLAGLERPGAWGGPGLSAGSPP